MQFTDSNLSSCAPLLPNFLSPTVFHFSWFFRLSLECIKLHHQKLLQPKNTEVSKEWTSITGYPEHEENGSLEGLTPHTIGISKPITRSEPNTYLITLRITTLDPTALHSFWYPYQTIDKRSMNSSSLDLLEPYGSSGNETYLILLMNAKQPSHHGNTDQQRAAKKLGENIRRH